ncbi:MAG: flippase [Olsenella sp.]|jgi:O-antigen/teichoic acid export membrane protein|nr:flippase [Olsenella sp.]
MAGIKKNFLFSSAYQLLTIITPIITTPYLSRVIGAEGNGAFSFTQSVTNYFVLFAILGMSSYGVRAVAECGDDRARRSDVFWNAFSMTCLTGTIVVLAYVGYVALFGQEYLLLYLIWGLWVVGSVLDVSWLFFGCQTFSIPTTGNFITKLCSVVLILVLVKSPGDVWAYVLAISGANFANSVIPWFFLRRFVDPVRPRWSHMLSHLKPTLVLFVPVIAISIYGVLDKIMLGVLTSVEQVGYFDYAEKISKMPLSLITALGAAVLPRMAQIIGAGRIEEGKRLVGTTMWSMLACAFALSFGIVGVAPSFCPAFFGDGFDACVPLMSVLAFVIPTICVTNVIGNQYMLPCHRDREYTISVSIGAAVNVVANLITIPLWGAMGAALSSVLSEVAVMVAQVWCVRGDLDLASYARDCLPFALAGVLMAVVLRILDAAIRPAVGDWPALGIEFVVGAATYLALALIWSVRHERGRLLAIFPRLGRYLQADGAGR